MLNQSEVDATSVMAPPVNPANAAYLTKGKLIEVNGRLSVNAYVNLQGAAVGNLATLAPIESQ